MTHRLSPLSPLDALCDCAKRYGKHSPGDVLQVHAQFRKVPMIDHWRDRREAMQRAMGVAR